MKAVRAMRCFRACMLGLCATAAIAQPGAEFVDPLKLLPKPDESAARRGWVLWNREPEEDWLERLRRSPPSVVAVFLRWFAAAPRTSDFELLVCLNRPLEEPENGYPAKIRYTIKARIEFADGASNTIENISFYRDRCGSIGEPHRVIFGRLRDFSEESDLRFRPGKIKSVSIKVSRKTTYEQEIVSQVETFIPSLHIHLPVDGDAKLTRDFITGRVKGEALRSARKCANIATAEEITPPAEDDGSDYAKGFALGWKLAGDFLVSDRLCQVLPSVFEIEQVGIGAAIRAVKECTPPKRRSGRNPSRTRRYWTRFGERLPTA